MTCEQGGVFVGSASRGSFDIVVEEADIVVRDVTV